jgi:signal transduction histidine kinase
VSQDVSAHTYVFPLSIPAQSTQTLYLRYEHSRATRLPLHLWSPAAFARQNQIKMWIIATRFTTWLLMLSGLLLFWIRLPSQRILYFMLAMGAILVIVTLEQGIGRQYLWPNLDSGIWLPYLHHFIAVILFLSGVKFTMLFLDTKQQYPTWHKVLQALMILMLLLMIQIPFVADHIVSLQMTVLYILAFLILIVLGVWVWIRTYQRTWNSIFTSLLFICFMMAGFLSVLGASGFFPFLRRERLDFLMSMVFTVMLSMFIGNRLFIAFQKQQEAQRRHKESALALQKANEGLEQRVLDRTRELSVLYDVTSVASQALDLKTTMAQCLDRVVEVVQGNVGAIHLVDETGQLLRLATTRGLPSDTPAEFDRLPTGKGLTGQVLEQGEIVIVPDVANDPRTLSVANLNDLQSYAGIPIRASGSILGVLGIARKRGQPMFSVEEVALLGSIADQVGVVVESAMLREQAEQAAVMEERQRLARELHDSVTQSLHSANLIAGALPLKWANDPEEGRQGLVFLQRFTQGALAEMRTLLLELYPAALEERDLPFLLRQLADSLMARTRAVVTTSISGEEALPTNVRIGLYRIAQETLNNVVKHSGAREVRVTLQWASAGPGAGDGAQLILGIKDNGRGFDLENLQSVGLGIGIMRERARDINAAFTITSQPDLGTEVLVAWSDSGKHKLNRSDHKPAGHHRELVNGDEP